MADRQSKTSPSLRPCGVQSTSSTHLKKPEPTNSLETNPFIYLLADDCHRFKYLKFSYSFESRLKRSRDDGDFGAEQFPDVFLIVLFEGGNLNSAKYLEVST